MTNTENQTTNKKSEKMSVEFTLNADKFNRYCLNNDDPEIIEVFNQIPEKRQPHIKQLLALITTAYRDSLPADLVVHAMYFSGNKREIRVSSTLPDTGDIFKVAAVAKNKYSLFSTEYSIIEGSWSKEIKRLVNKILSEHTTENN